MFKSFVATALSCMTGAAASAQDMPGKLGVWTKADSVIQFDDLTVVAR